MRRTQVQTEIDHNVADRTVDIVVRVRMARETLEKLPDDMRSELVRALRNPGHEATDMLAMLTLFVDALDKQAAPSRPTHVPTVERGRVLNLDRREQEREDLF